MLTVKVKKNDYYLLPPNCAFCNAELPAENTLNKNGVAANAIQNYALLKYRLANYRCSKCGRLYTESQVFTRILPFIILIIGLKLGSSVAIADQSLDLLSGFLLMIGFLVLLFILLTIGYLLAVLYIRIRGEHWSYKTVEAGPARITRKFREKGYHFINFSNNDFGRAFAELNQGEIISSNSETQIGF